MTDYGHFYTDEEVASMVRTGKATGFLHEQTLVLKETLKRATKRTKILDYGCGSRHRQANILWKAGHDCTIYDIAEDFPQNDGKPHPLEKKYDIIMISNVLNVQPSLWQISYLLEEVGPCMHDGTFILTNFSQPIKTVYSRCLTTGEETMAEPSDIERILRSKFFGVDRLKRWVWKLIGYKENYKDGKMEGN